MRREKQMKVIRLTRHPADNARINALKGFFGVETQVIDNDIPYGDDPVKAVVGLLQKYGDVVAFEVVAPIPVLAKLTQARRELGDVLILRAEFQKGADGRAITVSKDTSGRDVFGFGHYDIVERVEVITRKLGD